MDKEYYHFNDIVTISKFETAGFTNALYEADKDELMEEVVSGEVIDENNKAINVSLKLPLWPLLRLWRLQVKLCRQFVGCEEQIKMLLSAALAQEPILFIGKPGVAKTELAVNFFNGIGLRKPAANRSDKTYNKYYEYLLSPFTVPEELFGPLDIKALMKGDVTRLGKNMVTGELVRGVFLDEIFNASSNILNTLLMLINERRYFDKGMFWDADLKVFIGASNSTPIGRIGDSESFGSKSGELAAFYDRFTVRLYFPTPQEKYPGMPAEITKEYEHIERISLDRHYARLDRGKTESSEAIACINDILLLGRLLQQIDKNTRQTAPNVMKIKNRLVSNLGSPFRGNRRLCSMSPRKPNKLAAVIAANSLLLDMEQEREALPEEEQNRDTFLDRFTVNYLIEKVQKIDMLEQVIGEKDLRVFDHIWDYEGDRTEMAKTVQHILEEEKRHASMPASSVR